MGINRAVTPYKQELAKKLNLFHLIAFGLNYMIPFAPAIIFGIIAKTSGTTVSLPYLFAMIIMSFTAFSYVYMVKRNPVAGSLYSYVESIFGKRLGFLAGWILFLDYILIPTVVAMSATIYLQHYIPEIPYYVILCSYVLITGLFNLLGINIVANVGLILLLIMEILLIICLFVLGSSAISTSQGLLSLRPFEFNSISGLFTATTLCVLSYLGYDAISTLAEEAKNPRRDVPKAIVISLLFSGFMMFILGYLAVLATPNISSNFNNQDWVQSALFYIMSNAGGYSFTIAFTAGLIVCMVIFNIVATAAGARLLYGMGRDRAIPRAIFGKVNKKFKTPHNNILIIIVIELVLGLFLNLNYIVDLVNFGAILGFTILNIAVFYKIFCKNKIEKSYKNITMLIPLAGAVSMLIMISMMEKYTLTVGIIWSIIGVVLMFSNKYLKPFRNNSSNLTLDISISGQNNKHEQIQVLKSYWNYDHWNVSNSLLEMIDTINPESMIIIEQEQKVIGSIVAYNYDSNFAYFGLYYIVSEFRGQNYGAYLTGAALMLWQRRNVACDSVFSQVLKYQKLGFKPIYENRRFVFSLEITHKISKNILPAKSVDINDIIKYDSEHFYCTRDKEITFWIKHKLNESFVYLNSETKQIEGLVCIVPSKEAYRVGPLYAKNPKICIELLKAATNNKINKLINIDIPMINSNKDILINHFNMTQTSLKFIRMHKGNLITKNINNLYGHLSIELG
ncbi:amino acid permease [Francisella hispaniensis]|nr:amino acid permease [Francisella hispaniensis]